VTINGTSKASASAVLALWGTGLIFAAAAQDAAVVARDAWVRVPAPSKNETALYAVLENHSTQKRKVVSVTSDAAQTAEMHEMRMERMMMVMMQVKEIKDPAKVKTSLNPNGLHVMLFGLKSRPAPGDMISATFKLDDGSAVPVTATVRK
jgi:copper(I)-binding protein